MKSFKDKNTKISMLPLMHLRPSHLQPRSQFDSQKIDELAHSILEHGILQPLVVRKHKDEEFEIVAGERRFRAAKRAGLKQVPCVVMDLVDGHALAVALVENVQREDLNPIEEAKAYLKLKEALKLSQEEIAKRVGKDRASVTNLLRLLRLPLSIQEMLIRDSLSMGHARALLALESNDMMIFVARKAEREGLSVRRLESLIRALKHGEKADETKLSSNDPHALTPAEKEIRKKMEHALGQKVEIKKSEQGYVLSIKFETSDAINNFLELLQIEI